MKRALTIANIQAYKPTVLPFTGEWLATIGEPELTGSWLIWGKSGNGKTRFAIQLIKYLCNFSTVAYDSLEEGLSFSIQTATMEVGMSDRNVKKNFILLDKEPIKELIVRLKKQRSPKVIVIDSLQYTRLSYKDYAELRDTFRDKLFIFISHADGKEPRGNVAQSIRYDAFVKIYVEGYKAIPQSRFGGGEPYIIWEKGANKYWGE